MSNSVESILLEPTCIYGSVEGESERQDMQEKLGDKLLDYRITKIKCFLKSKTSIFGIQFIYRNINDCKETTFIDVKSQQNDLILQEMNLANEEIRDLRVWLNQDIKLIGFEVITNKRSQKFGYGNEDELIKVPDFENLDKIIVGFGCYADQTNGVTGLYAFFINRKKYISIIYTGIFALRIKIKDSKFKEEAEKKLVKMNEKNKILYKICQLPDNQFFNVIKYSID